MGFVAAQGSTAWNAADAATTTYAIDLSGSGFSASEPLKAIIFFFNAQTSTTDATASADVKHGFGVATGTAARGCGSIQWDDGALTPAADCVLRTDSVACYISTLGADAGRLDLSVFGDDDFTLIVDVQVASDRRVHWIALGGSDFDVAQAGTFTFTADDASTQDVTVTGFEASPATADQCVIIIQASPIAGTIDTGGRLSVGAAAGTSPTNYHTSVGTDDVTDPTNTNSYCISGEISSVVAGGAVGARSSVSAWVADGFRFNRIEAAAQNMAYVYLAMKGPRSIVGDFLIPNADTNPFSESSFGFSPDAAIFLSSGRAQSTSDTGTAGSEMSIGVAANTTDQRVLGAYDTDNVATQDCDHTVQYGDVVVGWSSGGGTLDTQVALDSFDADGMTLHCTNAASAANKFVWYLAMGESAPPIEGTTSESIFGATDTAVAAATASAAASESIFGATDAGVAVTVVSATAAESIAAATEAAAGTVLVAGTASESIFGATDAAAVAVLAQASAIESIAGMSDAALLALIVSGAATESIGGASDGSFLTVSDPQNWLEPTPEYRRALALEFLRRRQH